MADPQITTIVLKPGLSSCSESFCTIDLRVLLQSKINSVFSHHERRCFDSIAVDLFTFGTSVASSHKTHHVWDDVCCPNTCKTLMLRLIPM